MSDLQPKVLAIVGSFRKQGNTDLLVDAALAGAQTRGAMVEKIYVDDLKFSSCEGCYECKKEGICKLDDDVQGVRDRIEAADAVIIGSPIYGNYMTGQLKMLLDRLMGVINKSSFDPVAKKLRSITRLETKRRNVYIILPLGAPRLESADDALKLLRRMTGSFAHGGFVEALVATSVSAYGYLAMSEEELAKYAQNVGVPNAQEAGKVAFERNQGYLNQAREVGCRLVDELTGTTLEDNQDNSPEIYI